MSNITKWWVGICVQITGLFLAWYTGAMQLVIEGDKTKIVFLIMLVWFSATVMIARNVLRVKAGIPVLQREYDTPKYLAGLTISLGLMGTIIGFALMFMGVDFGAITSQTMVPVLFAMLNGIKTALFTTMVGVIGFESIRFQLMTQEIK